ncbi:stalk domain-containing protein [Calidifontibacillus oryziterrae]|uniref:stalk domain-containing protein n=1 Tax=Calidifontibacillus oryziterrae TaxID=1191699 RepID=UPI00031A1475|nr:stalk domain-containing protein [Calidifontibacillus oryziterrae]
MKKIEKDVENLKKIAFLLVAVMLTLVGCTSTNPSLKDVYLNAMDQQSAEGKVTISADINIDGMKLTDDQKKVVSFFESGFVMEQKVLDQNNAYMIFTAVNDQPLRDIGVWTAKEKAAVELFLKGEKMYFRTSADQNYFMLDLNEVNNIGADGPSQYEIQQKVMEFMKGSFKEYVTQFDYEIPKLQDLGMKKITTPEGEQQVLAVKMEFGVNEVLDFAVYTLNNLANYENLDKMAKEYLSLIPMPAEFKLTDEQISEGVKQAQTQMSQFTGMLSGMTEESLEQMAGFEFDFKVETELGISMDKYVASEDSVITVGMKNPTTGEQGSAVLNVSSLVWNVNGDVQLPEITGEVVDALELEKDINKVKALPDQSPLKKLFMQEFNATFTIDEPFATLGTQFEMLDAAPYTKDGNTMVPLATVGKWLGSEAKWEVRTGEVTLDVNGTVIQLKVGSKEALVNGEKVVMNTAAETKNGRTFVPVAFIANELGAKTSYDAETKMVKIYFE